MKVSELQDGRRSELQTLKFLEKSLRFEHCSLIMNELKEQASKKTLLRSTKRSAKSAKTSDSKETDLVGSY